MKEDSLTASVRHDDYSGTAAADRHDQNRLRNLADKYGVDTEKYFVFGIDYYIREHEGKLENVFVSILAVDSHQLNAYSVDEIQQHVDTHDGKLPYIRFDVDASLDEVLLSFKRFHVVLTNSRIRRVKEYQPTRE